MQGKVEGGREGGMEGGKEGGEKSYIKEMKFKCTYRINRTKISPWRTDSHSITGGGKEKRRKKKKKKQETH